MRNDFSNGMGTHDKSAPRVADHVNASGEGNKFCGRNTESATGRVGSAVLVSFTT